MQVKNVVFASAFPGFAESIIQAFPNLKFCVVPAKRGCPMLTDDLKHEIKDKEVLVADAAVIPNLLSHMPKLKWMQATSAGVDKFFSQIHETKYQIPKQIKFTRMTGVFGPVMGEYVISQIIAHERLFYHMHDNQKLKKWDYLRWGYRLLYQLTVGIMGFGDIGKEVARLLKSFGCTVLTYSTTRKSDTTLIDKSFIGSELTTFLASCDYLVSILPSIPSTRGLLNNDLLKCAEIRKPVFINIGRGDLIAEDQLVKALEEKWISAAILDVFETEPLPETSKLWTMPQVVITPHVSGITMPHLVNKVFAANLEKYEKGEILNGLIDWDKEC